MRSQSPFTIPYRQVSVKMSSTSRSHSLLTRLISHTMSKGESRRRTSAIQRMRNARACFRGVRCRCSRSMIGCARGCALVENKGYCAQPDERCHRQNTLQQMNTARDEPERTRHRNNTVHLLLLLLLRKKEKKSEGILIHSPTECYTDTNHLLHRPGSCAFGCEKTSASSKLNHPMKRLTMLIQQDSHVA